MGIFLAVVLLLTPVITFILLAITNIPLGVSGEWVWSRIEWTRDLVIGGTFNLGLVFFVGLGYFFFAVRGLMHFQSERPHQTIRWLLTLVVWGFIWLIMVQDAPPPAGKGYRLSKVPLVLYAPKSSGYFYTTRYKTEEGTAHFLSTYEKRMARGDVLHEGTHPPGLYLMHQGSLALCEAYPALTDFLLSSFSLTLEGKQAFEVLQKEGNIGPIPLTRTDMAAIWFAGMLTQFLAVLSVVPLFYLLRRFFDASLCWKVILFFPLLPALAIFLPKSDALFPFVGMTFLSLWLSGWDQKKWWLSLLAGIVFWVGMFFSLAILPVGLLAFLLTGWEYWFAFCDDSKQIPNNKILQQNDKPLLTSLFFAGIGFCGMTLLVYFLWDLNLLNVWKWNYQNHAAFYSQFHRTYWKWLLVNPVELMFAVGLPLSVAVIVGVVHQLRHPSQLWQAKKGALFCTIAVWGILWLSGKNRGEAARLWLVLEIWGVWLLCYSPLLQSRKLKPEEISSMPVTIAANIPWVLLLGCQLIACLMTVMFVTGFDFSN